jgi:hypothetical protein
MRMDEIEYFRWTAGYEEEWVGLQEKRMEGNGGVKGRRETVAYIRSQLVKQLVPQRAEIVPNDQTQHHEVLHG